MTLPEPEEQRVRMSALSERVQIKAICQHCQRVTHAGWLDELNAQFTSPAAAREGSAGQPEERVPGSRGTGTRETDGARTPFTSAPPLAVPSPSAAAIEAAKQCYHVEDWDFLNGDTAERVLRAAYAIDTPPCALTPNQRAAILMAILDLEAAADELDRPQAEWRWDELRRVRIALEYLRPVAPSDDPDKPFRDSWHYAPPRALSVEHLAALLLETEPLDHRNLDKWAANLLPRLLGTAPAKARE